MFLVLMLLLFLNPQTYLQGLVKTVPTIVVVVVNVVVIVLFVVVAVVVAVVVVDDVIVMGEKYNSEGAALSHLTVHVCVFALINS